MIITSYKEAINFCLISDQSVLHIVTNLLCVNPASSSVLGQRQDKVPIHIRRRYKNNSTQHIWFSIKHVQTKPNTFKRKRYSCTYYLEQIGSLAFAIMNTVCPWFYKFASPSSMTWLNCRISGGVFSLESTATVL